ncbi:heavy metal translocating P-type ATPase [Streptomyces sp. NPDC048603]|uniref:heavy metal translocating P-type ATPase n=1 Tax=Streptomyces sp. NPDC048603 TaxID=3365577 RepID=UPI003716520D
MTSVSEHTAHRVPDPACGACSARANPPRRAPKAQVQQASRPPNHERAELAFALAALAAYLTGLGLDLTGSGGALSSGLFTAAYAFGGFFTFREALAAVRRGTFQVDFLMLVAAAGAAAIGKWEEGAVLLVLFSLGHALESYAMGRARRSVEALGELAPRTAWRLREGTTTELPVEVPMEVPVEDLAVGDTVLVRPHTRIPADGRVTSGTGSIDQSAVTGESIPADKRPTDRPETAPGPENLVHAGTVNGSGTLEIAVTRLAADNTLARVLRLVREAEERKSPTQRFTDRFQKAFVPAVLALVAVLLAAGTLSGEPFKDSFYRAMAVLVAASPCALAIATPVAVLSAVGRAARSGVLIKGGAPLEEFGRLRTLAFDKTGTLTEGRPRLTDVEPAAGAGRAELLRAAVAVQRQSDHPLARAVVRDAPGTTARAVDVRAVVGRGVTGELDGSPVHIGSLAHADTLDGPPVPPPLRARTGELAAAGRTTMLVRHGDRWLGVLGLMDAPREAAAGTVAALRGLGVTRMVMLSGDDRRVAGAVGRAVGMDEVRGGLMPEDKAAEVARLRREGGRTAMIGDGVNDAPAMAGATVAVAMGAAGSPVALETADIALMSDDLRRLPFLTGLSRRASRIIRQNLWLSLGIVAVLVPATVLGLGIGPAVLVHEGSTLIVVANALRLLRHPD